MATIASSAPSALQRERAFFFYMALAVAANAVAGFAFARLIGFSSFGAPWWVHVHALTMMGWLGLYVTQNWLVWRGKLASHRQLGILGAAWAAWLVPLGVATTAMNVHEHRLPSTGAPALFLAGDWLAILTFGGLVFAAIRLRNRSDWHKRLMLGAMIVLIGPGIARLLPAPLLRENTGWVLLFVQLVYFAICMVHDHATRGKVHSAWYWGAGMLLVATLLNNPLASLPPFAALTKTITG